MTKAVWTALLLLIAYAAPAGAACTPTGHYRDGINMTAALINPGNVTGAVDATGCNIGVYYDHTGAGGAVKAAEIFGANYFGVLVNGDGGSVAVDILGSTIRNIGENPLNGAQHGVAIYYRGFSDTSTVTGKIAGNTIFGYQKGGIVANGPATQTVILENTVTGEGHVVWIAQNGIQIGYGATASVMRNVVSGNSYVGFPGDGSASGGILVVGGAGYGMCPGGPCALTENVRIVGNRVSGNDVGIYLSNWDLEGPPATATNVKVINNVVENPDCFNISYQAGISDVGNNDKMINNTVTGDGYAGSCGYAIDADVSFTSKPKVHANK